MKEEALKLALEALEDRSSLMKWQIARDAVKEALAQLERNPQRTWVGLTKYEHDEILITSFSKVHHAIKLTQDKLREKNTCKLKTVYQTRCDK